MWPAVVACACPTWSLWKQMRKKIWGNLFAFSITKANAKINLQIFICNHFCVDGRAKHQVYSQHCREFHDQLWEALSGTTSEKRGVPSRTGGGDKSGLMLWSLQRPWFIGLGGSQPYSRGEPSGPEETDWCRGAKIAARQFLSLTCLAITLTAGLILKED